MYLGKLKERAFVISTALRRKMPTTFQRSKKPKLTEVFVGVTNDILGLHLHITPSVSPNKPVFYLYEI